LLIPSLEINKPRQATPDFRDYKTAAPNRLLRALGKPKTGPIVPKQRSQVKLKIIQVKLICFYTIQADLSHFNCDEIQQIQVSQQRLLLYSNKFFLSIKQ
jgi:hypothetical protein